jgi:hypothetical protein
MSKIFPIVIDTWTEHERGWGSRPDGMSLHLSTADHKAFVDAFNKKHNNLPSAPDEYTTADNHPKVVDVPESLYKRLVDLKAKGETGMWAPSREGEKLILAGKDPFDPAPLQSFKVVVTVTETSEKLAHASGRSVKEVEADLRRHFQNEGYNVVDVKATLEEGK